MTLAKLKPKNLSIWLIGALMVYIPIQYHIDPSLGFGALRVAQTQIFQISAIVLFAVFIVQNIYLSLFLLWAVFSYTYYQFAPPSGAILISILAACFIYEAVYRIVNQDNIEILYKFMIWFAVANVIYMFMQSIGWEVIYKDFDKPFYQKDFLGFMGLKAIMGMFFAMCIPFIAYKYPKITIFFFVPIALSQCSSAVVAGAVAYLWQIWNISKKWFFILLAIFSIGGGIYIAQDTKSGMFTDRINMWRTVMQEAAKKPITGWGMDSFRSVGPDKQYIFWKNVRTLQTFKIDFKDTIEHRNTGQFDMKKYGIYMQQGDILDPWDNPHNEYLMLFFEFGILMVILLGFLIYDIKKRFSFLFTPTIPLIGFFLGVLVMSVGQFPFHLARIGFFIPIFLSCYYKLTDEYIL